MSGASNGVSRRSLMTATALASLAAMTGCGGGSDAAPAPGSPPPPPPPPAPVSSKFLYTANSGTPDSISSFSIAASTGFLGAVSGPSTVGTNPQWIAAHPTGKFVFAVGDGDLRSYTVNQTTGALTQVDVKTVSAFSGTIPTLDVHPDGSVVYVANTSLSQIDTYAINSTTGALTLVFPGSATGLTTNVTLLLKVHPNGKFLYAYDSGTEIYVFPITTNGELVDNGHIPRDSYTVGGAASQLVFNSTGTMVYTSNGSNMAGYPCNPTTGVIDTSSPTLKAQPSAHQPTRLALHPGNRFIYGIDDTTISMINVGADGSLGTLIGIPGYAFTSGGTPTALAIDYSGTRLYATLSTNSIDVFTIASDGSLSTPTNFATGDAPQSIAIASFS